MPVGIDVLDFLAELGMSQDATEMVKAVYDCVVIVIYYLLRVGEYTLKKKKQNKSKGAVQVGKYYVLSSGC